MYYAIQWTYGRATDGRTGRRIGSYHKFPTAAARDAWVSDGNPYKTNPGSRDPIASTDAELRRLLRDDRSNSGYGEPRVTAPTAPTTWEYCGA